MCFFNKEDIWFPKLQNHLQLQEPQTDQNKPYCFLQVILEAAFSGPGTRQAFLRAALLHDEQLLITILPPQHVCCYIDTAPPSLILLLVGGSDLPRAHCCRENNVIVQTHKIKTTRNHADACKNIHFTLTNVNASTTCWRLRRTPWHMRFLLLHVDFNAFLPYCFTQ